MPSIRAFVAELSSPSGPGSLAAALPRQLEVASAGPFPLAKHAPVPGHPVGGTLMLGFESLSFGPLAITGFVPGTEGDTGADELTVVFAPTQVRGRYDLFALEAARVDLDTGGALHPFASLDAMGDAAAGDPASAGRGVSKKQFDQVMQANAQRAKLNQTANGRALVDLYHKHNDAYNDVFNNNAELRKHWRGDGAIAEMSDHTSEALKSGAVVNPDKKDKTFGTGGNSYNANAFAQQLNVWAACANKHPDAASAALNFKKMVQTTTGNTDELTKPFTGKDVFDAVQNPPSNVATMLRAAGHEDPLHAPLLRIAQNTHDQNDFHLLTTQGLTLKPNEIESVQAIYAESLRIDDPAARLPLAAGDCAATLEQTTFRFRLTPQPDGAITVKLVHSTFALDRLDFGSEQWPGQAGEIARERLGKAAFLRDIIEDRLTSQLTRLVRRLAADAS